MSTKLTLKQIRTGATAQSFARGEEYYNNGAIFDTVMYGNEIEGSCEASSQPEPYHIRAKLGNDGIAEASCTCEYEYGGLCKHIVALLLTYLYEPEQFTERQSAADSLASREKDDLIALIRQMVKQHPDLQALIDRPVPGKSSRKTAVDTSSFRKELKRALRSYGGYGDRSAERTIRSIAETAEEFSAQGDWRSASAIYRTIAEECLREKNYFYNDEEGYYAGAVDDVLAKLAGCLEALAEDDNERRAIFKTLVDCYVADIDVGDVGADIPDYVLRYARQSDVRLIREQVQAAQKRAAAQPYHRYMAQAYADFLAELDTLDNVDPEVTLARLREEEMYNVLCRKLVEMGRYDEALDVIEKHITTPYERLVELPQLVAAGRGEDAVRLAKQTLKGQYDNQIGGWLLQYYKEHGDKEAYLELLHRRFEAYPSEQGYAELKAAAEAVGRWEALRQEVIEWLRKKQNYGVLVQVYLHDQDWDAAWEALERQAKSKQSMWSMWGFAPLDLEVARRSQAARPERAIPVFVKYVRSEIGQRDRSHYAAAAEFLKTVRDLYKQIGDQAAGDKLVASIRSEFPQLRALQDELKKAGL